MQVKLCGLSSQEEVIASTNLNADFCGFILNYPKSHRYISYEQARKLTSLPKKNSKYVGVLVKPTDKELEKYSKLNLDYFQIYDDYTNDDIYKIKLNFNKKIISAIQVKNKVDVLRYKKIDLESDIILWDSSGLEESLQWDYEWIKSVPKNITKMIAGNIDTDNLDQISKLADIVDVSGALETNKVKDINKIKFFLEKVKEINYED